MEKPLCKHCGQIPEICDCDNEFFGDIMPDDADLGDDWDDFTEAGFDGD